MLDFVSNYDNPKWPSILEGWAVFIDNWDKRMVFITERCNQL